MRGWVVAFGRFNESKDAFLIVYEAAQGSSPKDFSVKTYNPPQTDTGWSNSLYAGTPFISKGKNSVGAFMVQGHLMLDISGVFQVTPSDGKTPLDVFTSIDVTELNGYLVGWGFVSGSQPGLQELKKSNIAFATKQALLDSSHP